MERICQHCGKTVTGEAIRFCPFCGEKMTEETSSAVGRNPEAEVWIRKALAVQSYPERRKILLQGLAACPNDREIAWELLFTGEPEKKRRAVDFSVIGSWVLEIYRKPGIFTREQRNRMRAKLFDDPELKRVLGQYENPEKKHGEYLLRLCRDYLDIFLEGSNEVMGTIFGLTLERNKEKKLAVPVAEMIGRIRADGELTADQRERLWKSLYQAYAGKVNGKTEYLDERIPRES